MKTGALLPLALLLIMLVMAGCTSQLPGSSSLPVASSPAATAPAATANHNPEKSSVPAAAPAEAKAPVQNELQSAKLEPCGSRQELFSVPPTGMDKIVTMTPVGMMSPPDHVFPAPHMYFFPIDFRNPKDIEVPVYASADMYLSQIGLRHYNSFGAYTNYVDYTLVFSPCKGFDLYFHHIRSLTYKPFADAAAKILKTCSFSKERNEDYCSGQVNVPIKAGQQFATAGDLKAGVWGFDLGARDYRIPTGRTALLNPDRHCDIHYNNVFDRCYVVCPFDYFTKDIRDSVKYSNSQKDIPGLGCGGNLYFDVKDTAQGYWFSEGSGNRAFGESSNVFLGPNNLDPLVNVFSVGTVVPDLKPGLYSFVPSNSGAVNRDFKDVTSDGTVYCYETKGGQGSNGGAIVIQLTTPTTLRLGKSSSESCGSGSWLFGSYADFER